MSQEAVPAKTMRSLLMLLFAEDELDAADPLQGGGTSLTDPIAAARYRTIVA